MQSPAVITVMTPALVTLQTSVLRDVNVTFKPLVALAESAGAGSPKVMSPIGSKAITWSLYVANVNCFVSVAAIGDPLVGVMIAL